MPAVTTKTGTRRTAPPRATSLSRSSGVTVLPSRTPRADRIGCTRRGLGRANGKPAIAAVMVMAIAPSMNASGMFRKFATKPPAKASATQNVASRKLSGREMARKLVATFGGLERGIMSRKREGINRTKGDMPSRGRIITRVILNVPKLGVRPKDRSKAYDSSRP